MKASCKYFAFYVGSQSRHTCKKKRKYKAFACFLPGDDDKNGDEEVAASKRSMMHCLLPTASMQPRFLFNTCSMLTHPRIRFFLLDLDQVGQDKERRTSTLHRVVMVMVTHYVQWTLSRLLKNRQIQEAGWVRVKSSENQSLEMSILNLCNQHCPTVNARQVSLQHSFAYNPAMQ